MLPFYKGGLTSPFKATRNLTNLPLRVVYPYCVQKVNWTILFFFTLRNLCEAQFSQHKLCRNNQYLNRELKRITEHVFSSKATWRLKAAIFFSQGKSVQYCAWPTRETGLLQFPPRASVTIFFYLPANNRPPHRRWAEKLFYRFW